MLYYYSHFADKESSEREGDLLRPRAIEWLRLNQTFDVIDCSFHCTDGLVFSREPTGHLPSPTQCRTPNAVSLLDPPSMDTSKEEGYS